MVKAKLFLLEMTPLVYATKPPPPLRVFPESCHGHSNIYEISVLACQVEPFLPYRLITQPW